MATEILYSGLGDLMLSSILHQELQLLLADRSSIWGHPALVYLGDLQGAGSTAIKSAQAGLDGYDEMAAVAEGSSTSNTALTDGSATATIARQALQYQMSDLAGMVGANGLDPVRLAASMVGSASMRFTTMIAALASGFSQSVGSTGVDMSVDDFFDADIALSLNSNPAQRLCMLHPRQVADLRTSLRAEGGAIQFMAATAEMLMAKGPGFVGSFLGVDIFQSSKIATANAGADRAGMMFCRGAMVYADGTPRSIVGAGGVIQPAGSKIVVEFERDAAGALTKVVGNYYVGVAENQDLMGVGIVTDA